VRKIPTLFVRDPENRRVVLPEVTPGCEWVADAGVVASRKFDGTCVMFDGDHWWARREVKPGKMKPVGFTSVDHDDATGKTVGWEPAGQSSFARIIGDVTAAAGCEWRPTTYELIGPKVNGNPEGLPDHLLMAHGLAVLAGFPTTFEEIREEFATVFPAGWEGVVWRHPDGRMVKIKQRDFAS